MELEVESEKRIVGDEVHRGESNREGVVCGMDYKGDGL